MNIFSFYIIIIFFILILLKITYFLIKNREKGIKIPKHQTQIKKDIQNKNKWLYPTDKLGKIERGVVYDEKVFDNEIKENKITSNKV